MYAYGASLDVCCGASSYNVPGCTAKQLSLLTSVTNSLTESENIDV